MLKERREKTGLTQKGLSEASGVPLRTIQNWELRGVDHATVGNLKKAAAVLGCSLDDLAGGGPWRA